MQNVVYIKPTRYIYAVPIGIDVVVDATVVVIATPGTVPCCALPGILTTGSVGRVVTLAILIWEAAGAEIPASDTPADITCTLGLWNCWPPTAVHGIK